MIEKIGEPTPDEIVQSEISDLPRTVPVKIETPVRVQQLPAVYAAVGRTDALVAGDPPLKILNANPKRKRVFIVTSAQSVSVAFDQQSGKAGQGFLLSTTKTMELTVDSDIYVAAEVTGAIVSWVVEYWTG